MSGIGRVFGIYGRVLSSLRHGKPAVPLLLFFLLQVLLIALYLWSGARAPALWGLLKPRMDAQLIAHYPEHLLLMGSILGRLDILLEIFVLALAEGATVLLVAAASRRESLGAFAALRSAGRAYLRLIIVAAASSIVLFAFYRYPAALLGGIAGIPRGLATSASALIDVAAQAFLLFAIPFVVIEGRSAPDALRRSFGLAGRHFVEALLFALVPFLLTVPTLLLSLNAASLAYQISPEFLIHVQIAGEAVQFIATFLLVGGPAIFFIETRNAGETP